MSPSATLCLWSVYRDKSLSQLCRLIEWRPIRRSPNHYRGGVKLPRTVSLVVIRQTRSSALPPYRRIATSLNLEFLALTHFVAVCLARRRHILPVHAASATLRLWSVLQLAFSDSAVALRGGLLGVLLTTIGGRSPRNSVLCDNPHAHSVGQLFSAPAPHDQVVLEGIPSRQKS